MTTNETQLRRRTFHASAAIAALIEHATRSMEATQFPRTIKAGDTLTSIEVDVKDWDGGTHCYDVAPIPDAIPASLSTRRPCAMALIIEGKAGERARIDTDLAILAEDGTGVEDTVVLVTRESTMSHERLFEILTEGFCDDYVSAATSSPEWHETDHAMTVRTVAAETLAPNAEQARLARMQLAAEHKIQPLIDRGDQARYTIEARYGEPVRVTRAVTFENETHGEH